VSVVRLVTVRIVRVVRTAVSVAPSATVASALRRETVRSALRRETVRSGLRRETVRSGLRRETVRSGRPLVSVVRSVTVRIVRVVRTAVSVAPSAAVASAPLAPRVASVGHSRAVLSVLRPVTARSVLRQGSGVRSLTDRNGPRPAIGPRPPTVAPTETVRIAPGVRRPTIAGPQRVTASRRVTVRSVRQSATAPIEAPEQPDVRRATAASARTRRAAASDRPRGSASARSVPHRSVGRVRSARRATTSGRAVLPRRSASLPRRSPRTCCSRTWTARFGRGFAL